MKIQVLENFTGEDLFWFAGDIIDLPEVEALRMVEVGTAILISSGVEVESSEVKARSKREKR